MKLMERKHREKVIDPYPVSDKVTFKNVDKTLTLYVRTDAPSIVLGIKKVLERLSDVNENTTDAEKAETAMLYARTIFGKDQAEQMMAFYGDPLPVITACGIYFHDQLSKKITKAQKK